MIAGGFESFTEESSHEFAQLSATSSSADGFATGHTPAEMGRPCATTCSGFVEGISPGTVTLMSASAAIGFGAPIYRVVAITGTATDREGKSVLVPGKWLLTSAREAPSAFPSPLLDINYCRKQLDDHLATIDAWAEREWRN
ncbi:hypothetical protein GQ54DRAFT_325002 [Martensiomyces pterosporus]|nr:hypothetical protein GQ54DRAFT_325002 [Martensiomyces pterosporus]